MELKDILIYDRVTEAMQIFCSNHSIDEVYNTKFLQIIEFVRTSLEENLEKFAPNAIQIWNVFLPKPDVPPAIAANYKEVKVMLDLYLRSDKVNNEIKFHLNYVDRVDQTTCSSTKAEN
jgi:hypothetical protein